MHAVAMAGFLLLYTILVQKLFWYYKQKQLELIHIEWPFPAATSGGARVARNQRRCRVMSCCI